MTTKIDGSFSKQFSGGSDRKYSENNESQFSNFNLNQNTQKCSNFSSFVQSKNKSNFVKNSAGDNVTDNYQQKERKSWSKTSKGLKTSTLKDVNFYGTNETKKEEKVQKRWKNDSNNSESKNASTLSLHISAYEDSIEDFETEDFSEFDVEKDSSKIALNSFAKLQDSFEFPRSLEPQQQSSSPQVMQFKASQKLYNPNQFSAAASSSTKPFRPPLRISRTNRILRYLQYAPRHLFNKYPEQAVMYCTFGVAGLIACIYKLWNYDTEAAKPWYRSRYEVVRPNDPRALGWRTPEEYPPPYLTNRDNLDYSSVKGDYGYKAKL